MLRSLVGRALLAHFQAHDLTHEEGAIHPSRNVLAHARKIAPVADARPQSGVTVGEGRTLGRGGPL
jgi:hypothetical protein